jgi:hypothetical protein
MRPTLASFKSSSAARPSGLLPGLPSVLELQRDTKKKRQRTEEEVRELEKKKKLTEKMEQLHRRGPYDRLANKACFTSCVARAWQ